MPPPVFSVPCCLLCSASTSSVSVLSFELVVGVVAAVAAPALLAGLSITIRTSLDSSSSPGAPKFAPVLAGTIVLLAIVVAVEIWRRLDEDWVAFKLGLG